MKQFLEKESLQAILHVLARRIPAAAQWKDDALEEALSDISCCDNAVCQKLLAVCRPVMEQMQPCPKAGWLEAMYAKLTANLFPDEAHPRQALSDAEELYLAVLEALLALDDGSQDPLTGLLPIPEASLAHSRVQQEYEQFTRVVRDTHLLPLLRITKELRDYDPFSHTVGVHNVALHTAIMAQQAGFEVDLPLVSAAALGHDIGKFGCRGSDSRRIPYLHYYYTWQWFSQNGLENIGHISANHSTWDLEFENLPVESLLLIYADFRVRGRRKEGQKEEMCIYSLKESYDLIFSKLADMTPQKQQRYQTVYHKLNDFEHLLQQHGVPTDMTSDTLAQTEQTDASLLSAQEALQSLRSGVLSGSIHLMHMISTDQSFEQILEQAKTEKNRYRIRTYLHLLREYSTYMSTANKKKTLVLLYELLMHPDGDVRRAAGEIVGLILANSGPKYRKERPDTAAQNAITPTIMALLDESVELWAHYIDLCLYPDLKNSPKHTMRIANSLKTISRSLFAACDAKDAASLMVPLLQRLYDARSDEQRIILVDALSNTPSKYLPHEDVAKLMGILEDMVYRSDLCVQVMAMRCMQHLQQEIPHEVNGKIEQIMLPFHPQSGQAERALSYMRVQLLGGIHGLITGEESSRLYLSNLKNAVHWGIKLTQIELLASQALRCPEMAFHTALHLSNLLCVSEHLPVRESAGEHLVALAAILRVEQINELCVDLLRELENGQEQVTHFIAPYIGKLISMLPEKELCEAVDYLRDMVHEGAPRTAGMGLRALGEVLCHLPESENAMFEHILGILMTGVSHYEPVVHQMALTVLCRDVFGSDRISLERRGACFVRLHKKLLTVLSEPRQGRLTAFNSAAMLNHLYRFIVNYEVTYGAFPFPAPKPAAFFPGTFDPFSVGHKQIVERIRSMGFEVYLAVDEFSWSKKTLAKMLRRQIVSISVADQWDTYIFPDDIPINIAMPHDLARLQQVLHGRELYLVAGSDVILNASAYRRTEPGTAADYNHIIFYRADSEQTEQPHLERIIRGKLQVLTLPTFYESVSSTRIREYVDQKMDISMLVDPVVQTFIYDKGLYIRSPEMKRVLSPQEMYYRTYTTRPRSLPKAMRQAMASVPSPLGVTLSVRPNTLLGWAVGHTLQTADLYDVVHSVEAASYVRRHVSGRILLIDAVHSEQDTKCEMYRMLLNELLARSLTSDHTYALCRCTDDEEMRQALLQLGFVSVAGGGDIYCVDMRKPVMLLQDMLLCIKQPYHDEEAVKEAVQHTRPRLRHALTDMFPGKLLLCFDSEMLNQALMDRVERIDSERPEGSRLGRYMCVPYGKILSDSIVPGTVTKTLHVEKCFYPDLRRFEIEEYPDYSPIRNQVRMLKSFERPVLLVDDLLHKGYRLEKLDKVFRQEDFAPERIVVAVMSGNGRDLMRRQGRKAECEYFIPDLHYWVTESLLYPFIGGDSVIGQRGKEHMLPSINLILPYYYPNYFTDVQERHIHALSRVALENALEIMQTLEKRQRALFDTALSIRRLSEALYQPRLPDQGGHRHYDFSLPASVYLEDDLLRLERVCRKE